jgi:hypothetical protein
MQLGAYVYTAQTNEPARRQGAVVAAGLTWSCQGQTCSISGPWDRPAVEACRALADQVGPIASYGRPGMMLSASELAVCNAGQVARILPRPRLTLPPIARRRAVTTPELSFVGGAMIARDGLGAVDVAVSELSFVGGAQIVRDDAAPVEINASELSFIGQ